MSAAYDNFKKGWLTLLVSFVFSLTGIVIAQSFSRSDYDARALRTEIESKAPYSYVDKEIEAVKALHDSRHEGYQKLLESINNRVTDMHQHIINIKK
jgi:hypothetical protein